MPNETFITVLLNEGLQISTEDIGCIILIGKIKMMQPIFGNLGLLFSQIDNPDHFIGANIFICE
jgi:hypothetical protein